MDHTRKLCYKKICTTKVGAGRVGNIGKCINDFNNWKEQIEKEIQKHIRIITVVPSDLGTCLEVFYQCEEIKEL